MVSESPSPDTTQEESDSQERRTSTRLRFRLRTLLILVTLIAVGFGVYQSMVAPYLKQGAIRIAILQAGFACETEPAPAWLSVIARLGQCLCHHES